MQQEQAALGSRVAFLEEVNYSMEEAAEKEEVNYMVVNNRDRDVMVKEAFKKKRKGTL